MPKDNYSILSLDGGGCWALIQAKLDGLRETFGPTADVLLPELPKEIRNSGKISPHFLIVGFDYDRERVVFFRSDTASRAGSFSARPPVTLAQAVHASSTAPIN